MTVKEELEKMLDHGWTFQDLKKALLLMASRIDHLESKKKRG